MVVTASYQASVPGFMKHLQVSESKALELIKLSVVLARRACEEVASSTGGLVM